MNQLIDFIFQYEASIRLGLFLGGFSVLALWEWKRPKRELTQVKFKRWLNNIALVLTNTIIVRVVLPAAAVAVAYMTEKEHIGLSYHIELPYFLKVLVIFILLDFFIYIQHVMFHVLPLMWRFHRVHHSDLDCDLSTGLRFHPVEILVSIIVKLAAIIALGAPVFVVILFEALRNLSSMFTHSNVRLNLTFEHILRWFIVTPDMHRIHHSMCENETNSNFSFNLSLWDRVFSTYKDQPEAGHQGMTIGLNRYREPSWQNFSSLLLMPFSTSVRGYAINSRDTKNADELAMAKEIALHSQEKARLASELASYIEAIDQHALVSITDLKGIIVHANDKFCEVSGYSREELIGQDHRIVNSGTHSKAFFSELWSTITSGHNWQGEVCNKNKNGELYWLDTTIVPVKDEGGEIIHYISVRIDISKHKAHQIEIDIANSKLEYISRTDSLTQIANRRYFDETLLSEINKLSRTNAPLTLLFCDIDYFKNYNDRYGHLDGDMSLQRVAKSIDSSFCREGELVARYGGEEFAVILPNVHKEAALILAEKLRQNIELLNIENKSSSISNIITISIGVTTLVPNKNTDVSTIIAQADKALYLAKDNGRNNVQYI